MAFTTNYDKLDEQSLKPKGEYECVIKNSHEIITKNGTPYIAVACSIRADYESLQEWCADLEGRPVRVVLEHDTYNGNTRERVKWFNQMNYH